MGDLYVNLPDLAPNHDGDTYMNLSDLPKNKPPPPLPVKTPPRTPPRTPPQTPPRTPPNRQSGHITPPRHGAHKYPKPFVATGRRTHSNSPSHSPVKVRTPPPKQPVHRPAKHASPEKETDISLSPSIAPTVSVAPTMNMTMGAEVSSVDMEESDSGFEVLVRIIYVFVFLVFLAVFVVWFMMTLVSLHIMELAYFEKTFINNG